MLSIHSKSALRGRSPKWPTERRGGAVIVIVLALMAMLAFLGFFFYSFVQVELGTSRNYSEFRTDDFNREEIIDAGMRQIVTDTDATNYPQSVLAGGKMSLLAHVLGTMKFDSGSGRSVPVDHQIRNGRGIIVVPPSGMTPPRFIYTGTDANPNPTTTGTLSIENDLILNRSPAANGGGAAYTETATTSYEPDVSYTYPDLNALFLAMDYTDSATGNRVIKPSFMAPGIYTALASSASITTSDFYKHATTQRWMFRPHELNSLPDGTRRYTTQFPMTLGNMGVWTSNGSDYSGLDVDADKDGVKDSIYLDLGYKPILLPDNRLVVPMYFFKIEDLNGLIDLNSAGNMADFLAINRAPPMGGFLLTDVIKSATRLHLSNLGARRAEINSMFALTADPTSAPASFLAWDEAFYRSSATPAFTRDQLRQTEFAMLLLGSPTNLEQEVTTSTSWTTQTDDVLGRFGDTIPSNAGPGPFAAPGTYNTDDDLSDAMTTPPTPTPSSYSLGLQGVHPSDAAGRGRIAIGEDVNFNQTLDPAEDVNGNGVLDFGEDLDGDGILDPGEDVNGNMTLDWLNGVRPLAVDYGVGPMRWPFYSRLWQQEASAAVPGTYSALDARFLGGVWNDQWDDPAEVNRYHIDNTRDRVFSTAEIAALHLANSDWARSALFSRVRNLAPLNFHLDPSSPDIRSRFTTESWNRREFSFPYEPARSFEFNDSDGANYRFPPVFSGVAASRHETGFISNNDPFRPEVRRLLTCFSVRGTPPPVRNRTQFPQLPLELNRVLDGHGQAAFNALGNPQFRELTPHVNFALAAAGPFAIADMVHDNDISSTATYPATHPVKRFSDRFTDPAVQEWWARYDRQRLARDIYTLLVTLCYPFGTPTDNPASTALAQVEDMNGNGNLETAPVDEDLNADSSLTPSRTQEFAQFAVNVVDYLDGDDVITRFDYDENLADGWNPSGNLYVNGVEAQKLSFSEVLWLHQVMNTNLDETYHNESDSHHQFLNIELRNCTRFDVPLSDETWRIVRVDPANESTVLAAVKFTSDKTVLAGRNFVISSHDGTLTSNSGVTDIAGDFYAKLDAGDPSTNLDVAIPTSAPAKIAPSAGRQDPLCDLDLCHLDHAAHYNFTTPIAGGTKLVLSTPAPDLTRDMKLLLQRRRNAHTSGKVSNLGESDWITVDRIGFTIDDNNVLNITAAGNIVDELKLARSYERYHPLMNDDLAAIVHTTPPAYVVNHTLDRPGATRVNSIADPTLTPTGTDMSQAFATVWQPHFDRPMTSVYELLNVPLVGPHDVLTKLKDRNYPRDAYGGVSGWGNSNTGTLTPYAALGRFVPGTLMPTTGPYANLNLIPWTRLLSFFALPDPTDRVEARVNASFEKRRTFGEINLNTIRHPEVLGGLLDDSWTIEMSPGSSFGNDKTEGGGTPRNWWTTFQQQRDGFGLPGNPSSKPFVSPGAYDVLNVSGTPAEGVEKTMLRHNYTSAGVPSTAVPTAQGTFEARTPTDIGADHVDFDTRYRLLRKVANNSTNRSNVFAIWAGVEFFEVDRSTADPATGVYQIGAKVTDISPSRWFFVVDMTLLEEAAGASSGGAYNWQKFVIHRQRLE